MDESIVRIVDCMVYAQSDLFTAEQGIQALKGRDYAQVQMTIAAKGINDAINKLQTALSIINDGQKITQETANHIGSNNHGGDAGNNELPVSADSNTL